jgi:hypothetical protein
MERNLPPLSAEQESEKNILNHNHQRVTATMTSDREIRLFNLCTSLKDLTDGQVGWVEKVLEQFHNHADFIRLKSPDIVNDCILQDFGDALRINHCFSREAFTKDKFEYALERVANIYGIKAKLAPRGNPGHDITINTIRFSLKTQADKGINPRFLHISKFMELGKGQWGNQESDLVGLREQFFHHMQSYDRILSLRRLKTRKDGLWKYELVEIPKSLLEESKNGDLKMMLGTKQTGSIPGYCDVFDENGTLKFQLYFDGGTERKLQIKRLDKSYCTVHAEWVFETKN